MLKVRNILSCANSCSRSHWRVVVRLLKEELQLLQEPGSYVGEVVKVMGKKKVLVKVRYDCYETTGGNR